MNRIVDINESELTVFQSKSAYLVGAISFSIMIVLFAAAFIYAGTQEWIFLPIGIVFSIIAYIAVGERITNLRNLKNDSPAVFLRINNEKIIWTYEQEMTPHEFKWSDVSKIVLTKCLVWKPLIPDSDEYSYNPNQLIIYFGNYQLPDAHPISRKNLSKSPDGAFTASVKIPAQDLERLEQTLRRFANNRVEVKSYSKIVYSQMFRTEEFVY